MICRKWGAMELGASSQSLRLNLTIEYPNISTSSRAYTKNVIPTSKWRTRLMQNHITNGETLKLS
jgi:hypothetical protein